MTVLHDFDHFAGTHWETGSVHNYYAYLGFKAPHTGKPFSEALLLGVSGGVVMGYFSFAYEGYDPMARILTRNTFNPFNVMLERLGVVQDIRQTASPAKAVDILVDTLEAGYPAIVWADQFSLPYNNLPHDEGMWAMFPILVYGYDETDDWVWIADRAQAPLLGSTGELKTARGRVKKDKHRLVTLDPPNPDKLVSAVRLGISDTVKLFYDAPPKGSRNNFGLAAFHWLAEQLVQPKARQSWERVFPAGVQMYAGLLSAYMDIKHFGKRTPADRGLYAEFLKEASVILEAPALDDAADSFRQSARLWEKLALALLPDEVEAFAETRRLSDLQSELFHTRGSAAMDEIRDISEQLANIRAEVQADFPLEQPGIAEMRANIRDHVMAIHDIESVAVGQLKETMQSL